MRSRTSTICVVFSQNFLVLASTCAGDLFVVLVKLQLIKLASKDVLMYSTRAFLSNRKLAAWNCLEMLPQCAYLCVN